MRPPGGNQGSIPTQTARSYFRLDAGFPGEKPLPDSRRQARSTSGYSWPRATPKGHIPPFASGLAVCSHWTEHTANTRATGPRSTPSSPHRPTIIPVDQAGRTTFPDARLLGRGQPVDGAISNDHDTPAPNHYPVTAQQIDADPTPAPVKSLPGLFPTPDIATRNPERPLKHQKTMTKAENKIPLAGARGQIDELTTATMRLSSRPIRNVRSSLKSSARKRDSPYQYLRLYGRHGSTDTASHTTLRLQNFGRSSMSIVHYALFDRTRYNLET
jgi:hypothetical protein